MMNQNQTPLSEIIRMKNDEDNNADDDQPKTRDDWKKAKELEEARKAGTAPAAVDEEGRDINPHIPQYISAAPWYYNTRGPTLKHQRQQDEDKKVYAGLNDWYHRGVDHSKVATKFRKGACENCGALTHKKKDCMDRPRKIGAKFTGAEIAPDEPVQPSLDLDFDGKRDRWNGYDPNDYVAVVDEFQKVEEAKRHIKAFKIQSGAGMELPDNMVLDQEGPEDDEDKYVDDVDMPGTKVDSKQRITVRNLRIREDTAKYLRNLDPNSAYYDPKTRAMRDNPYKDTKKDPEDVHYAGENFVRYTGDTNRHAQAQLFAWEAVGKGVDVHLLAEPTKLEVLQKEFEKKKDEFKGSLTKNVINKYGGEAHLEAPPKSLLLAQTEDYVEYSRQGKIIKGGEKPVVRSKYDEDVYPTNHSTVFGSYWRDGQWGYHCCHSLILNSYCTGITGRAVNDSTALTDIVHEKEVLAEARKELEPKTLVEIHRENLAKAAAAEEDKKVLKKNQKKKLKRKERKKARAAALARKKQQRRSSSSSSSSSSGSSSSSSSSSDSSSEEEDEEAKKKSDLKKALKEEERRQAMADLITDDRKRAYNTRYDDQPVTEAELEAYHMRRTRDEDPMNQFLSKPKKAKK